MKLSLLSNTVFTAIGLAKFHRVPLPGPPDWVPSPELMQREACPTITSEYYHEYNAQSWAEKVLRICETTLCGCTSTISYSQPLIPGGKDRVWVGRMFRGSSTSALNYERNPLSQDAIAYTYEREAY